MARLLTYLSLSLTLLAGPALAQGKKLSTIPQKATPPALTDQVVGVTGGNTDNLYSVGQLRTSVQSGVVNITTYGAKCDGITDDTAAWASLIAAVSWYTLVQIPQGCITLTNVIHLDGLKGIRIFGTTAGEASATAPPVIRYNGAAGGSLITCEPCADVTIEGLVIDGNNLADRGIQAESVAPFPTYNMMIDRVGVFADHSGAGRTNFIGVDWCGSGPTSNCENLTVQKSTVQCSGTSTASIGILIGHSNSVQNTITESYAQSCGSGTNGLNSKNAAGISIYGMTRAVGIVLNANGLDFYVAGAEPIEVGFNRTENGSQFILSANAVPLNIHDNRLGFTATPAACWISLGTSAVPEVVVNNVWDLSDTEPPYCSTQAYIFTTHNQYPTAAVTNGIITSLQNYFSMFDTPVVKPGEYNFSLPLQGEQDFSNGSIGPVSATGLIGIAAASSGAAAGSSGVLGFLNASGDGAAVRGTSTGLGTVGGINEADMVAADFGNSALRGNGTTAIGFHGVSPSGTVGTWSNIYGIRIDAMAHAGITSAFGIYQAGASDNNYFAGPTSMSTLTVANGATCAAGATSAATMTVANGIVTHC